KIEVLGDFDWGSPTPPRIEGGLLVPERTPLLLRHRLLVPASATFSAEVEAVGAGKLDLLVEGEGPGALGPDALRLEVDAQPKAPPRGAAATPRPPPRPPLPRHVWIPLARDGLDAWKTAGRWSFENGVFRAEPGGAAWIRAKELEGRALERYEFKAEVRIDAP